MMLHAVSKGLASPTGIRLHPLIDGSSRHRLHNLRQDNLGLIAEAYYSLYPEKKNTETVYCFFDEIQAAPGWEPFVDRLMRTEKCEVYLTGSSAKMLSKEIATQMRGRALSWEMFPFSFREFLDYKGIESEGALVDEEAAPRPEGLRGILGDRRLSRGGRP